MRNLVSGALLALGIFALSVTNSTAHHGWAWTTGGNIELTGLIKSARLGNRTAL